MNKIFEALADPHRRKILELLWEKDMNVSDLLQHFSFRQASLSHHLKVLKEAKIVSAQRRGQFMYYTLQKEKLFEAVQEIGKLLGHKDDEKWTNNKEQAAYSLT